MGSADSDERELILIGGEIKTPPFSREGRREAGALLRRLREGEALRMPHSRPMPSIGPGVHELRVRDADHNWRIVYRVDSEMVLVVHVFEKTTRTTPKPVIDLCRARLKRFDA